MNTALQETPPAPPIEMVRLHKLEKPRVTFFYQRLTDDGDEEQYPEVDGEFATTQHTGPRIEAFSEKEAAGLAKGQWRQVGVSDGKAYYRVIQETIKQHGNIMPIAIARAAIQRAFDEELKVARANKKAHGMVRPIVSHKHIGAISSDVQHGLDSLMQSGYLPQQNTQE